MDVMFIMNVVMELALLFSSTVMICSINNYVINIVGLILITIYSMLFLKTVYLAKTKKHIVKKGYVLIFIIEYVLLYINIDTLTKMGFSIGKWISNKYGLLLGSIYILALSIIIILWIIITIIWVFRMSKDYSTLKASIIIFGIITIVLLTSTIYYANLFEDYNNYYSNVEIVEDKGLFLSDGNRVTNKIDYLYFSSVMIFTIGYDEISIVGSDLKILVASEMFISYLLMCIFVPSIFTLISSKE